MKSNSESLLKRYYYREVIKDFRNDILYLSILFSAEGNSRPALILSIITAKSLVRTVNVFTPIIVSIHSVNIQTAGPFFGSRNI